MPAPGAKDARVLARVAAAREILARIRPASVRAACYQLFIQNHLRSMAKTETNKVSADLVWARELSLPDPDTGARSPYARDYAVPFDGWIVDETRGVEGGGGEHVVTPREHLKSQKDSYDIPRWSGQPVHLEVWAEKATLGGTLRPVLRRYEVPLRITHGYSSATAIYDACQESQEYDKPFVVLYLGDLDPSGLHMSEADIPRRLAAYGGGRIAFRRIALTPALVARPDPATGQPIPSFPATDKRHDARYPWWVKGGYGPRCWELDALSPVTLRALVEGAIRRYIDQDAWGATERREAAAQARINRALDLAIRSLPNGAEPASAGAPIRRPAGPAVPDEVDEVDEVDKTDETDTI